VAQGERFGMAVQRRAVPPRTRGEAHPSASGPRGSHGGSARRGVPVLCGTRLRASSAREKFRVAQFDRLKLQI
jgi:hypothetical protein